MDWQIIRAEYPALERWTYLNTATYGQTPRRANEAMLAHVAHRDETASTDFLHWYEDMERVRASVAKLIDAQAEDIAFVPNSASALATVIAGLAPASGDNIVTLDQEFPTYQYMNAARKTAWEGFYGSIDGRTRLVALSEVNYATGFRVPVAEVSHYLRTRGIPFFVDGTQSVGALRFSVRQTPVDVLAVHAYKWLGCPTGGGFMYVSPEFRARLAPSVIGWRSHFDWRNVDRLHHGTPEFAPSAEKYEGGGLPFQLLYALGSCVDLQLEIGSDAVEQRLWDLASLTRATLEELGAAVPANGSQIVCAHFANRDASELARQLRSRNIAVSARHGALRVSPHFYNSEGDVQTLGAALRTLL
jgi:selenocysteine lyase/cysteine desulfurase